MSPRSRSRSLAEAPPAPRHHLLRRLRWRGRRAERDAARRRIRVRRAFLVLSEIARKEEADGRTHTAARLRAVALWLFYLLSYLRPHLTGRRP